MSFRENYKCTKCGTEGVRLWREYQTFLREDSPLLCAICATLDQKKDFFCYADGDQIGWYVPAVPTPDGSTFWGYTSVPTEDIEWWEKLPTYKNVECEVQCLRNLLDSRTKRLRYYEKLEYDRIMRKSGT